MALVAATVGEVYTNVGRAWAAFGYVVKTAIGSVITSDPSISAGAGAPTEAEPNGSLWLRSGAVGPYARQGAAWSPIQIAHDITDPGDAGAIAVTHSGVCHITTAGAETRTLAIPTFLGQVISLCLDVDGGDAVVTVASAANQAGNNTLTGADAGDHIKLEAIQVAGVLAWRIVANDGWGLTTV